MGVRAWQASAGAVACAYAAAALAWILLSGLAVHLLPFNAGGLEAAELLKGAAFVALTAVLLWRVLRRQFRRLEDARTRVVGLAALAENSPNPVVALDADGRLTYANATALRDSEGEPARILPPGTPTIAAECLHSGAITGPIDVRLGQRSYRWIFLPGPGTATVFGYGRDRTEEERLTDQVTRAARMETVGRMSAGIAHDFNNMLTAIGGYAELMRGDALEGQVNAGDADEIIRSVERARSLIQQLMELSRPRPVHNVTFELNEAVREVAALGRRLVPPSLAFEVTLGPGPIPVRFDPGELEQAVLNLMSNAVDATPAGGRITLATSPGVEMAEVQVRDTGMGIAADHLPLVFDPFFTTKPHGHGTGLGLASVYEIALRHGGDVRVESTLGAGTTFRLSIPRAVDSAAPFTAGGGPVAGV